MSCVCGHELDEHAYVYSKVRNGVIETKARYCHKRGCDCPYYREVV